MNCECMPQFKRLIASKKLNVIRQDSQLNSALQAQLKTNGLLMYSV